MIHALEGLRFVPENLHLAPELHATEKAYRLVQDQGLSFREAYRRVGEEYRGRGRPRARAAAMRRVGNLWDEVVSWDNLVAAFGKARRGKRRRGEVRITSYNVCYTKLLRGLQQIL